MKLCQCEWIGWGELGYKKMKLLTIRKDWLSEPQNFPFESFAGYLINLVSIAEWFWELDRAFSS